MPDVNREEAAGLALEAARRAAADISAAWRISPGQPGVELDRARLLIARSRNGSVHASAPVQLARRLAGVAHKHEAAVRSGLQLLASAQGSQDDCRRLVRQHDIGAALTKQDRQGLLAGRRPTKAQREFLNELGVAAPAVLKLNDEYLRLVRSQLVGQLQEVVRLQLTAGLSVFASLERTRLTERTSLDDIEATGTQSGRSLNAGSRNVYRLLRQTSASDTEVATECELLMLKGKQAASRLAPLAVGLHRWATRGEGLRYRRDHAATSLAVASALRGALLAYAAGLYLTAIFRARLATLTDPWRVAARSGPQGRLSMLDGVRPNLMGAPERTSLRVRGMVESVDNLQVARNKRVAILRVRRGSTTASTIVLPFFNPSYVGIQTGTIVDVWVFSSDDVFAEFTNRNTARSLATLTERFGGWSGGVGGPTQSRRRSGYFVDCLGRHPVAPHVRRGPGQH
jgi:hypothetical protein